MIIDSLIYVFEADARPVQEATNNIEKGIEDTEKSMQSLEAQTKKTAEVASAGFNKLKLASVAMAGLVAHRLQAMIEAQADYVSDLGTLSEASGIAVSDLDAFGGAIKRLGGNQQTAVQQLANLNMALGKAAIASGGPAAKAFASLGVSIRDANGESRQAIDVLGDIADAIQGMDNATAQATLAEIGIADAQVISTLYKGRAEIERLVSAQKNLGRVSKDNVERANKLKEAQLKLTESWDLVKTRLTFAFMPTMTKVLELMNKFVFWVKDHSALVVGFVGVLAGAIATKLIPAAFVGARALWTMAAPILPFVALGAIIGLLADDIKHFVEGNDSMIGRLAEKWPIIGEWAKGLYSIVSGVLKLLSGDFEGFWDDIVEGFSRLIGFLIGFWKDVFGVLGKAAIFVGEWFAGIYNDVVDSLSQWFDSIISAITSKTADIWDAITAPFVRAYDYIAAIIEKIKTAISGITDVAGGLVSGVTDTIKRPFEKVKGFFGGSVGTIDTATAQIASAAMAPVNSVTSSSISNSSRRVSQSVEVGAITIQTQATDTKGIARDIKSELTKALDSLQIETASGVAL